MADHANTPEISDVILTALERFEFCATSEHDDRKAAKDDMEFYVGNQWPNKVKTDRDVDNRPCLTVNRLPQFVRQVTNDQRMNRPSVKVIPVEDSDEDVAKVFEGMIRHIQEASNADIAYDTACQTQVICGMGYFRVVTEYCDENSFQQDILIKRIKNPLTVYVDPSSGEPDYSDARYMFVVSDLTHSEFAAAYPGKKIISDATFLSEGDEIPQWASQDGMRIAEYWTVEEEKKKIYQLADGSVVADKIEGMNIVKERETTIKKIKWRMISCCEVLEEGEWAGKYIPIIPVLGDDLDVDGKRYLKGMIRDAKDSQRMSNYWISAQTEAIALAPKAPFIAAEGQIEGYKAIWEAANTKNYAYLPYKPTSIAGVSVPPPQRMTAEPPVQAMVFAMQQSNEDMKAITGIYDASLGNRSNETSGKAILNRQKQGDIANYHFQDNLSRSIRHLGRILLDLIPKIYDEPRVVRILGEDGVAQSVGINGAPTPQMPQGQQPMVPPTDGNGVAKIYDVNSAKLDVVVETGPSFNTKRQEAAEDMTMILQANPELWQIAGDLFVKNLDWPGADKLADRLKKMLPPQLQDEQPQIPPQVQEKIANYEQLIDQMTAKLHEVQDETERAKLDNESKEKIAAENNITKIVIEEMKNNFGAFQEDLNHIRSYFDLQMQEKEHAHQLELAAQQQPIDNAQNGATMGGINANSPA